MGNEASLIKKCTVSPKARHSTTEWSLFDATYARQQYSLFVFSEDKYFNDITRWKHIRHPNLVKCYEAGLCKGKKCILTEPINPVRSVLEKMHKYCKLSGLYSIGEALSFLHQVCGISVNNLSIDSIFISRNDCNEIWKLGSLYWYSSLDSDSEDFFRQLIGFHTTHGTIKTLPPEDREVSTHKLIRSSRLIHRRDSYAFANLSSELLYDPKKPPKLADMILGSDSEVSSLSLTIKSFVDNINTIAADHRPTVAELLNNKLFVNCIFLQIRQFFINFGTHNDYEKCRFFETFIERLRMLPDQHLVVNIFTMIVSSRVIMSSEFIYNHVMPYFLIPLDQGTSKLSIDQLEDPIDVSGECNLTDNLKCHEEQYSEKSFTLTNGQVVTLSPIISTSIYQDFIIPHISNLFCVHDYKIRTLLLLYLPHYGRLISKNCLRKLILPQILLGIKDSDSDLVSLTFRALAELIDIHGVVAVLGGTKRSRYFNSGIPRDSRLPSDTSQNDGSFDDRDNVSTISAKSNSTISNSSFNFLNYKMPAHMISERSSPDGDEIDSNRIIDVMDGNLSRLSSSKPSSNNLNLIEDDDEWPEWENGNESSNGFETAVESLESYETNQSSIVEIISNGLPVRASNNPKPFSSSSKQAEKVSKNKMLTFDIKEIDFKEADNKEIDNLFSDMEPVFDFTQKTIDISSDKQKHSKEIANDKSDKRNDSPLGAVNLNLFVLKHDELNIDDLENSGWNEDSLGWNDGLEDNQDDHPKIDCDEQNNNVNVSNFPSIEN